MHCTVPFTGRVLEQGQGARRHVNPTVPFVLRGGLKELPSIGKHTLPDVKSGRGCKDRDGLFKQHYYVTTVQEIETTR